MKGSFWCGLVSYGCVLCVLLLLVFGGNAVATGLSEKEPIQNRWCFVIDAGHGGMDGGTVSCTGVVESQINLEISLRLNDLLHLLGYKTTMTRTEDVSLDTAGNSVGERKASDLKARTQMINETENGILLCIHQNHYFDSIYSGAQMFYPKTDGSKALAESLQEAFIRTLNPTSHRQAKPVEGLYIMNHIQKIGVLIECGFLSNPAEEQKLRREDYQKHVCCVIASVCSQFVHEKEIT